MKTIERCFLAVAAVAAMIAPVSAQTGERRANLTGGGGDSGKCTIEVSVDGAADVEIRGDRGFLRTVSGQPAQWRRFECSGPMPVNPAEFRFSGVDGRGRQELVQDPRRANGAAIVRIQDANGGAEAYTFDLAWRGSTGGSSPILGQRDDARERERRPNDGARACQEAVRERANQQFGLRDIEFRKVNADDNPGSNDRVVGSFDARRDDQRDQYRFSCSVDFASGRVRGVDINPVRDGRDGGGADRYARRDDANSACGRAVEQRIERDGYRNVQIASLNADMRRNDWITGTASAQRGNYGRGYNFDIGCSVDPNNGNVRSVQVKVR